jgi:hypothetical protein
MTYINEGYADMHRIFGEAREVSAEAERLYAGRFPNRRTPSSHFKYQLWIGTFVFICLFPYQIDKQMNYVFFIFHFVQYLCP